MAGRWRDPAAFRADPAAVASERPSPRQSIALIGVLCLVAGTIAAVSYLVKPERARTFDLFRGSLLLADSLAPVAVDLASGKATVRLSQANEQVAAKSSGDLSIVPVVGSTMLLNNTTGEFNFVDATGFVQKQGGGVPLAAHAGAAAAMGVPDGRRAYIVQTGPTAATSVYLVGQSTVAQAASTLATSGRTKVTPSAFGSIAAPVAQDASVATAGNNDDLWLLTGTGTRRTLTQLSIPASHRTGARLVPTDHGTVDAASALGSATDTGSGAITVGVASPDGIQLFGPNSTHRTVTFARPNNVVSILPAGNQESGRLSFLIRTTDSWNVVSVGADGTGLRGPTPMRAIAAATNLASPAESNGALYSVARDTGNIVRIDPGGSTTAIAKYPASSVELAGFKDAYVTGRGSRVIVDSAAHNSALALFTDGSHAPLPIDKSTATIISATSSVEALAQSHSKPTRQTAKPAAGAPQPKAQAINNKIDCKSTNQKPYMPTFTSVVAGSRSVAVAWDYPRLDPQACAPSTYVLTIKAHGGTAPKPPAPPPVYGQKSANISGLFPSTQYDVTVTAYINGQGTQSQSQTFATGPEGPAAPSNVRVVADRAGNWTVSWSSCGNERQGCVPAETWQVIPRFCDGRGLSSAPAPIVVPGDTSTTSQPPAVLRGGDALLGRGVSFQVEGTGATGTTGTPSADTPCVTSSSPPQPATMALSAVTPNNIPFGTTTTSTVSLNLGTNPTRDVGGIGAKINFTLAGPNGFLRTKGPLSYSGSGSTLSAVFTGVQAGSTYQATATVTSPGRTSSTVTIGPKQVTTSADWPTSLNVTPRCAYNSGPVKLTCDLSVHVGGISSANANGERFDVIDTSSTTSGIRCGNGPETPLRTTDFDPATQNLTRNLSLLDYNGSCTVTVVLAESGNPANPVFGRVPSPPVFVTFPVDQPSTYTASQSDFSAAWDATNGSSVQVKYTGQRYTDAQLGQLTTNWHEAVHAPNGTPCGDGTAQPTSSGIDVLVPVACLNLYGAQSGWTVTVSYSDQGGATTHTLNPYTVSGTPPSYQPCDPLKLGFQASWNATKAAGVHVNFATPDPASVSGCSAWSYTLLDNNGAQVCSVATTLATGPPPLDISLSVCGTPPADEWSVLIKWNDTAGNPQAVNPPTPITGTPPTS